MHVMTAWLFLDNLCILATRRNYHQHGGQCLHSRPFCRYTDDLYLGFCTCKLVDRCGGHFHHLRAGLKEENESMGPHDRPMCKRREDT
jgi:hypothetical protein